MNKLRTHLSRKHVGAIRSVKQERGFSFGNYKPNGFWYGVDGDWERWCRSEMPDWIEGRFKYRIDLGAERILQIQGVQQFDAFCAEYLLNEPNEFRYASPDWVKLAETYDGLEIAPYLWERRHGRMWYYGWDCASGVIWTERGATLTRIA